MQSSPYSLSLVFTSSTMIFLIDPYFSKEEYNSIIQRNAIWYCMIRIETVLSLLKLHPLQVLVYIQIWLVTNPCAET